MPNVSRLATKTELTAIENKIPDLRKFATKTALTKLKANMLVILDLTEN